MKKLSTDELAEIWQDDKHGEYVQINPDGSAVEIAHGCYQCTISGKGLDHSETFAAIREWMDQAQYWPNIWMVSDHGNVELYTARGKSLGGLA